MDRPRGRREAAAEPHRARARRRPAKLGGRPKFRPEIEAQIGPNRGPNWAESRPNLGRPKGQFGPPRPGPEKPRLYSLIRKSRSVFGLIWAGREGTFEAKSWANRGPNRPRKLGPEGAHFGPNLGRKWARFWAENGRFWANFSTKTKHFGHFLGRKS